MNIIKGCLRDMFKCTNVHFTTFCTLTCDEGCLLLPCFFYSDNKRGCCFILGGSLSEDNEYSSKNWRPDYYSDYCRRRDIIGCCLCIPYSCRMEKVKSFNPYPLDAYVSRICLFQYDITLVQNDHHKLRRNYTFVEIDESLETSPLYERRVSGIITDYVFGPENQNLN